jgi:hypothetical protein
MKNYKVSIILYDNKQHTSKSSGCDIETYVQGQSRFQVEKMIEAQYNGCAYVRYVMEVK